MQGVEAGYAAALGTMAATVFWLASILFGLRFIVVPWMSLDLFRYWLGFLLLMKYFWDNRYAYKEVKHNSVFGKKTRRNIFGFHFLLALTEQTSLYPFLSNFSISSQSTLLEGFPSENVLDFSLIHFSYLLGIVIGSYSFINLICWFWQDPAYRFYFWIMNKFKKLRIADIVRPVHLFFQSITVLFAFSSLPYFGIEYQITNPLGFLPNDQAFHQFKQTSFLTHPTSPAYYRSRLNFPRQKFFRYEDWAEYYHRNTPLDTSLYDQGAYRLYTMEDLSYGKDYEWMRRRSDKIKIRSRLKRLRWFPRNWANRLWEFTKTWSRRNVLWRNDILNMYQYSWDSKAPIIWNKLVFEEFFPRTFGQQKSLTQKETELNKQLGSENLFSSTKKPITTNWDSFWGPDPDWTSKFLWNQNSLNNKEKQLWFNWQSRLNLTDNDTWWKWLMTNGLKSNEERQAHFKKHSFVKETFPQTIQNSQFSNKIQKGDFWEPQKRLISIYSENSQKKELVLESSTLRKFVRKLSARFKLAHIEKGSQLNNGIWYNNSFFSNSFKTLLLTPSFRDWTVFQTVMTNVNRILWWRRLTNISKSNDLSEKLSSDFGPKMKLKPLHGSKNLLSIPVVNNFKKFVKPKKLSYSENKFKKIQNKYFEIKLKQNVLMGSDNPTSKNVSSLFSPSKSMEQFSQFKNYKNLEINNLKVSRPTLFLNKRNNNKFILFKNKNKINNWSPLNSANSSLTLLHPLKYYLHKEQNFKRKLSFYGVKNKSLSKPIQNSPFSLNENGNQRQKRQLLTFPQSVTKEDTKKIKIPSSELVTGNVLQSYPEVIGNQNQNWTEEKNLMFTKNKNKLPIFNFYLKTYFQTYKKTKLYVLNTKMKRQLGMGASARRKGRDYSNKLLKRSKILANTPWIRQWIDQSGFLARRKRLETWIARQHYDPNELWSKIMKVDVDLFMNRQPSNYFLTNTEEKLLHLRRFLLFEHYDSLRWYTYMTNYRTMKNTIGGTKSFTNRLYNQQFKGTFHKVRHLFSLTPSSSNGSLLKFDRPLYNLEKTNQSPLTSQAHEELQNFTLKVDEKKPLDLIEKSTQTLQQSIWETNLIRKNYISFLLEQKNYNLLTKFLVSNTLETSASSETKNSRTMKGESSSSLLFLNPKILKNQAFLNKNRNLRTSASIKTNLQTKLMISLFRKRQKWTRDYKRTSEKLWKKWKLRSKLISNKTLYLLSNNKNNELNFSQVKNKKQLYNNDQKQEKISAPVANSNYYRKTSSTLNKKFSQIIKLRKMIKSRELTLSPLNPNNSKETPVFNLTNSTLAHLNQVKYNSVLGKALKEAVEIQSESLSKAEILKRKKSSTFFPELSRSTPNISFDNSQTLKRNLLLKNIFNNNIFTKKMIKEMYKKSFKQKNEEKRVKKSETFLNPTFIHSKKLSIEQYPKKSSKSLWTNSFLDYKLQNRLNNRFYNTSRYNFWQTFNGELKSNELNTKLLNQKNLQLYQKNLIRRERSNIQNFVFMKKFLVNDSNVPLTRSQIRPLPGKRTKALYEKSAAPGYYNSNLIRKTNPFLSSINHIDLKILAYKNRKWLELVKNNGDLFEEKIITTKKNVRKEINFDEPLFDKKTVWKREAIPELNNKWKLFVNKIKKSPKLISGQMDQILQAKMIKDQNLMFLTNAITDNIAINDLKKEIKTGFLMNEKSAGTILEDSSVLKNFVRQKLTKTILSKQNIINSLEKPSIIRITKSLRKRQQDLIVRSLLKRHLNLKARRKLFLKTKEINNQRMSLDRKYEIDERLFLNKISYFGELKQLLDLHKSRESSVNERKEYVLANKNLLKITSSKNEKNAEKRQSFGKEEATVSFFNSSLHSFLMKYKNSSLLNYQSDSKLSLLNSEIGNLGENQKLNLFPTKQQNFELIESGKFTNSKNLVKNFVSWLSLFNNKNLDSFSPLTEFSERKMKSERAESLSLPRGFSITKKRKEKNVLKNLKNKKVTFSILRNFQNKGKQNKSFFSSPHFISPFYLREKREGKFFTKEILSGNLAESEKMRRRDKQSYLSSIKRSSLFINKILKNNQNNQQNQTNESYLRFKLNQNFDNLSILENEKNILRRSLRKFISTNSMPPFLFEKTRRGGEDQLYKSTRNYSGKLKPITNGPKRKNSFVNNFLLKNWIRLKTFQPVVYDSNTNKLDTKEKNTLSSFVLEKISQKNSSKKELINLNKYIIFARTNQNKLSRQQIRKKLKKRRIIRLKRNERLKTLRDHPLKFRAEQIQTFYNIRDSLKKWKNFSFISSKVKYSKAFWKGYTNRQLLDNPLGLNSKVQAFSFPQNTIKVENLNENLESKTLNYKPLLDINRDFKNAPKQIIFKSNEKHDKKESSSLPFLENTLNPFYTNEYISFSDSFENNNILNSDLFYKLYQDIFINSPSFNTIGLKSKSLDFDFQTNQLENSLTTKLLVNNTNMPFYAGWDDSVRKFVLTNRLLTRREAGYEISNIFKQPKKNDSQKSDMKGDSFNSVFFSNSSSVSVATDIEKNLNNTNNVVFSSWPLKGKNAATTLFSQFPFMTAPETNLNNADKQIRVVKAGTKYVTEEVRSSTKLNTERKKDIVSFDNKWTQKNKNNLTRNKNNINELKVKSYTSDFSPNINFKKNKRIKTIIKSSKNEDHIGIRQSGQVISNLATPMSRKTARRALFSSRPWRSKRQTTKSILSSLSQNNNPSSLNLRKNPKLFMSLKTKKEALDDKLSSKLLLLRNLRHGNRSQTKLAYLHRLQNFIRPTGSAWKTTLNLSRRKKQRIKQSNFFSSRFSVRKRKKRGNNKNPRLRGDKNYKKTKRQYRQKLYLRPKNKPLRRRSLGVAFQNKLNYWRRQYQNLSNNQNSGLKDKVQLLNKQSLNCPSTKSYCLNDGKILFSQNLRENLIYSQRANEWSSSRRPRKLYRSLFKNPSRQTPILYSTLPGHSRSIPIIKNLPLPGSSVKTLNRIIKWSSADGASRFYRVNLSYGWAMELFLQNLHQKIKSKNNYSINPLIKEYLNQVLQTNKKKFSSSRVFKRRFYKLRQLSYTMSLRLYDRWFFYYYKTGNSKEQSNENFELHHKNEKRESKLSTFYQNRFNEQIKPAILSIPPLYLIEPNFSQFKHIRKFLTFHLNENQSNFRSYLKHLRTTSYLKTQSITTEPSPELSNSGLTDNPNKIENYDSSLLGDARTKDFDGLERFKLVSTDIEETGLGKSNLSKSVQIIEDKMNKVKSNKTLLKKEKKYAEDRFFFAQFNKPPLVDDSRLTFENNRHFPLNGGFVWPGDYLRLKTILLPKEMKDFYLLEKNKNFIDFKQMMGDKKKEQLKWEF